MAINLGTTISAFVILAGTMISNTGFTTVKGGNIGVAPGTAITGFPPGTVNASYGTIHSDDPESTEAQLELTTIYNTAAALPYPTGNYPDGNDLTGVDLGGLTLVPGVYYFASSAQLTGTLILDGKGDPTAQFIFQIGSTLTTAPNSMVSLKGDANPCNVFWQIGSSATIDTGTNFVGNILALQSITANTNATFQPGRLLARNGAVTLDTNVIDDSECIVVPVTPPTITSITSSGPVTGGTTITITGSGFTPMNTGTTVTIGGVSVPYMYISSSQITIVSPSSSTVGPVNITVTTPDGSVTVANGFTYTQMQIYYFLESCDCQCHKHHKHLKRCNICHLKRCNICHLIHKCSLCLCDSNQEYELDYNESYRESHHKSHHKLHKYKYCRCKS